MVYDHSRRPEPQPQWDFTPRTPSPNDRTIRQPLHREQRNQHRAELKEQRSELGITPFKSSLIKPVSPETYSMSAEVHQETVKPGRINQELMGLQSHIDELNANSAAHGLTTDKPSKEGSKSLTAPAPSNLVAQNIDFHDGYPHFDFKVPKSVQHAGGTVSTIALKKTFKKILIKRLIALGLKEAAAIPADEVGIGFFIQAGLAIETAWSLHKDWNEMWKEAEREVSAPPQTQIPKSNAAHSPVKQSAPAQPVNLGDVPVYENPINISSDYEAQRERTDRAYALKEAHDAQQARTEKGRADQRSAVNQFHNSKLWKVEYQNNLASYQAWLAKHDPKWLARMNGQAKQAYGAMTDNGKDFNLSRLTSIDSPEQLQKYIQARTLYRSDIRAREIVEYSGLELTNLSSIAGKEFNPEKLLSVRHNFDAVFAGKYGKMIAPDKVRLIESEADRVYRQETGSDTVDRASPLWKVIRNIQAVSNFRDLWATVQQPPVQVVKTVTGQPLPPLGGFGEGGVPKEVLQQETFPSGGYQLPPLGGFGAGSTIPPGLLKPETFPLGKEKVQPLGGFGEGVQPEINNVFASRRNLQGHEDAGGHTIDRHVGKSDAWLKNRLATDPDIRAASTFRNKEAANRTDGQFIKQNKDAINEWLRAKKDNRFIGKITMKQPIGTVIKRDGTKYESYTAEVIIVRDSSSQGWHILTSYPEAE